MLRGKSKWLAELITPDLLHLSSLRRVLYSGRTRHQEVEIVETGSFGLTLLLDGKTQSSQADEFVYHEALVHPALVAHPRPECVFIAGGGEGATAREVLRHRCVRQVVMVDMDPEVVDLCRRHLPFHGGAFDDPRLSLHFGDARAFLEQCPDCFDVLVLDLTDPTEGGPSLLLYTQEFYRLLRGRLRPSGLLVTQAGPAGPLTYREVFTALHNTLETVFPVVCAYTVPVHSFGETWGFLLASLGPDPRDLAAREIDLCLAQRGVAGLRFYDGTAHQGLFTLPKYLREALEEEGRVNTEAQPLTVF